jgi:thymidylate kinase
MIIIEGCDNTGKTTLREQLLAAVPKLIVGPKLEKPPIDRTEYMEFLWTTFGKNPKETHDLIFDRFFFSEVVYGPILRGKVAYTRSEKTAIHNLLRYHRPLVIHCRQSVESIMETFEEREQLEGVKERISSIVMAYDTVFSDFDLIKDLEFMRYNYKQPRELVRTISHVQDYLNHGGNKK